jgi:hypothetical protein
MHPPVLSVTKNSYLQRRVTPSPDPENAFVGSVAGVVGRQVEAKDCHVVTTVAFSLQPEVGGGEEDVHGLEDL